MASAGLLDHLYRWIATEYPETGVLPNLHCFRVFRSISLPDGGNVSAVSVRHQIPAAPKAPEHVVVELWNLCRRRILPADVKEMCLYLATFRASYAEILEAAELEGLRRRHRFSLHGNVVGESVEAAATVDLLSHHGGEVAFWTYRESVAGVEFEPYYGESHGVRGSALARMLDHLAWEAPTDPACASEAPKMG